MKNSNPHICHRRGITEHGAHYEDVEPSVQAQGNMVVTPGLGTRAATLLSSRED